MAAARAGALIVLPTDTVYGIGTRPDDPLATARLFAAKDRPPELTLPILCATVEEVREIAVFDRRAERLAHACWPGALTIVLPRGDLAAGWDLGGDPDTVGVRIPAHDLARAVLRGTGPLAVTSANRSGTPPARTCDELVAAFEDLVAVYLCQDEPLGGAASTVIDLAHGDPRILRRGDLDATDLARFMDVQDPLLDSGPS